MMNFSKSPLFLLLLAAPLMLGSPATRAAEGISPSMSSPVLAQTTEERKAEADRLLQLGIQQTRVSQFREALQSFEVAVQIYREIGDRNGEANSLGSLGNAYRDLGEYEKAIELYQQSLPIFREIGNRNGEAASFNNLGNAYNSLGKYERAIELYQQSLAIKREIGDRNGEADSLNNLGEAYRSLDEYKRAIDFFQQSLAIKQEIRSSLEERPHQRHGEANSLNNLGLTYSDLGQYEKAIDFYQQSLTIQQDIGNRKGEANSLGNLGNAYRNLWQYERAIDFHQQSLVIKREIGDRNGEAYSLGSLGNAYNELGQYERAIELHQQSLAIKQEIGDREGEANSLGNLGVVYLSLGQYERAIDFQQKSLAIQQEIGNRNGEANSLGNLGNAYRNQGQYERAIDFHQQSLAIDREIGDRNGEARSLGSLGNIYSDLGKYEREIDFYQQSLTIQQEIGDRNGEAASFNNLGNAYRNLGQYERAIDFHQQSLAIDREIGDRNGEAIALNNLGLAYSEQGQPQQATETLFASIEVYESLRDEELPDTDKISFFDTQTSPYKSLQRSLIAQGEIEQALEISERGRARAFVSLLAQKRGLNSTDETLPPPSIAQIQQLARQENATLVQYSDASFNDDDNPKLFVWVIQPTGTLHFREIDLDSLDSSLNNFIATTRETANLRESRSATVPDRIRNANAPYKIREDYLAQRRAQTDLQLSQLHDLLITPIADLLPTNPEDPIIFIPHRSLFLVPFLALLNADGEYLIQNHTILTAPSIQVLELTRQARRGDGGTGGRGEVLVVGNPTMPSIWNRETDETESLSNLPGAESEAVAIANLFNTQPLLKGDATETAVTQQMPTARIIHLATHGLLDYGIPEETGVRDFPGAIALATDNDADGFLTSAELLEMELQAELVVLSACNTGRGNLSSDGVVGLSRALIGAGVPNVMVSLWSVPDAPTADLMREFYQQWQATGNKAQALRSAMLATMETHPEPRNWAAFTLMGQTQ